MTMSKPEGPSVAASDERKALRIAQIARDIKSLEGTKQGRSPFEQDRIDREIKTLNQTQLSLLGRLAAGATTFGDPEKDVVSEQIWQTVDRVVAAIAALPKSQFAPEVEQAELARLDVERRRLEALANELGPRRRSPAGGPGSKVPKATRAATSATARPGSSPGATAPSATAAPDPQASLSSASPAASDMPAQESNPELPEIPPARPWDQPEATRGKS
jgi:hypothetical protein